LPLVLATDAAAKAVQSCEAKGYHVSAAIVDATGQMQVQLKGDDSTPHTGRLAYRKAYSAATFAPNYGLESSAEVGKLMSANPIVLQTIVTIPEVAPIPGAIVIKVKGRYIGAIGVSGAPGGENDETCARQGIAAIADRLPH
jgi:uncharacterized protein GlcG (DUF336 family)